MVYETTLAAKVAARNEVNRLANAAFPDAAKALEPFVGQKVCKVDGSLLEKVNKALPPTMSANGSEAHSWYSTGHGYNLVLNVKTCKCSKARNATPTNDYQIANYAESTVYLGHLQNGILTGLYDAPSYKTNYSESFVHEARQEVEQADKVKREAESKIHYFGLYD